jgi:single-stranded DNA-binding protein
VNLVGRLRNNNYEKDGGTIYGLAFTAEEVDDLDSRAEMEARRTRGDDDSNDSSAGSTRAHSEPPAPAAASRTAKARTSRQPAHA